MVFGRAQIPIPKVLIDRVADNGLGGNFTGTHFAGSHQRGVGLGIQLIGNELPVDAAVVERTWIATQTPGTAAFPTREVENIR